MTDKEKLVKLFEQKERLLYGKGFGISETMYESVASYLIDNGVKIPVNCDECKHRRDDEDFATGHYCVKRPSNGGYFCEDGDFCSYGERKNDE